MNINRILCPIDFSEFNRDANEFASALAHSWQASIIYLTVPEQDSGDDYEAAMQRVAERELKRLKEYVPTRPDIEHSHEVKVSSRTAQTIIEYARDNDVDLIVMATQGRSGIRRIIMGSVAEAIVRNATCPVLTLKPDKKYFRETAERRNIFDRERVMKENQVLCAVDVNDYDQQVIDLAATFAKTFGVDLHLLHITIGPDPLEVAWPGFFGAPNELARDNRRLKAIATDVDGVTIHTHHLSGLPVEKILGFVDRNQPQLLVMGTHARQGIRRILGSVATKVMRKATCPVVVLRQGQESEKVSDMY